jgi:hypothetical protein
MTCFLTLAAVFSQGGTQVREYAPLYPDNAFRRFEQCHGETRTVSLVALAKAACPLTARTLANDKGRFVYLKQEPFAKLTRYHARAGKSVPTDIHQNSRLTPKQIHFTTHGVHVCNQMIVVHTCCTCNWEVTSMTS